MLRCTVHVKMPKNNDVEIAWKQIKHALDGIKPHLKPEEAKGTGAATWKRLYSKREKMEIAFDDLFKAVKAADVGMSVLSEEIADNQQLMSDQEEQIKQLKHDLEEAKADETISKSDIKQTISDCLPAIIQDTVKETLKNKKIIATYANALKSTQEEVVLKAKTTLDMTLEKALVKNQQVIIDSTKMKSDAEDYERRNRARNIVVSGVEESASDENQQRIKHDVDAVVNLCNIPKSQIVKCFRAGRRKQIEVDSDPDDTVSHPRPIIVTLTSPEEAQRYHKFGFGAKIQDGLWINKDQTRSERTAAFNARKARRNRSTNRSNTNSNTPAVNDVQNNVLPNQAQQAE